METVLISYYKGNAKKLHRVVDQILTMFGGLSQKDLDDFYSLANEVFVHAMRRYDYTQSFETFLYSCLLNNIKSEMTKRNCEKRKADRMSISIDTPIDGEEDGTISDRIADHWTVETVIFGESDAQSIKIERYLNSLTMRQKKNSEAALSVL